MLELHTISQHSIAHAHCYQDLGKLIERPWGGGNWNRFPSQTQTFSKEKVGRMGLATFLLSNDERLSGEGVFNGIYYCPLGSRAPCTCIPLCTGVVILTPWLLALNLSIVNIIQFHNTQFLTLIVIKIWENWSTHQPTPFLQYLLQGNIQHRRPQKQPLKPAILISQLSPKLTLEG